MSSRLLTRILVAIALFSIGCDDATGIGDSQAANVRVVHASATATTATTPVDVAVNGQVATGNAGIPFGGVGECVRVDADSPDLAIRTAGQSTVLATPTPFTAGGRNTVVLSGPAASLRVTNIDDPLAPPLQSGRARIRVFNGTTRATAMNVSATPWNQPAAAVSTTAPIAQAEATPWLDVPAGGMVAVGLRNAGATTDFETINVAVRSGEEVTLVAADPATGQPSMVRWIATSPCPAP